MASFYVSAAHKSSGKTSVSIGLAGAMVKRGLLVQTFKRGPDYIDPIWLAAASNKPCYNLDFNAQSHEEILQLFTQKSAGNDVNFIEGSKGLFDGLAADGSDSNAALASLLSLPVVLVIDCEGITRGIAPLLQGYQAFDKQVNIAGVILNKTGGTRHEGKLRQAVENYTDIPILGALGRSPDMEIPERHLGLMPANEMKSAAQVIDKLTASVEGGINLDLLMALQGDSIVTDTSSQQSQTTDITIAVARDAAFGFYYPDDLEAFERAGAKLVFFDALHDKALPPCDGLFLGGGFPEMQLQELHNNGSMRTSIKKALESGLPCYAECGGLMYLSNSISWRGHSAEMVGIISGNIVMSERPQGRGFVKLEETGAAPWGSMASSNEPLQAHEFHYAQLKGLPDDSKYAYAIKRGFGIDGARDGLIVGNCMASFSHLRNTDQTPWVPAFTAFVRSHAKNP